AHGGFPDFAFGGPPKGETCASFSGMDLRYSTSAQRCVSVSNGPITPLPRGPFWNECPALELPYSEVSKTNAADLPLVSIPTLTGSNSLPTLNFLLRWLAGTSISYRFGTEPLCRNGPVAHTPSRGAAFHTRSGGGGSGS